MVHIVVKTDPTQPSFPIKQQNPLIYLSRSLKSKLDDNTAHKKKSTTLTHTTNKKYPLLYNQTQRKQVTFTDGTIVTTIYIVVIYYSKNRERNKHVPFWIYERTSTTRHHIRQTGDWSSNKSDIGWSPSGPQSTPTTTAICCGAIAQLFPLPTERDKITRANARRCHIADYF